MTAPGQPAPQRSPWYVSRLLLLISAVCFFFAAITLCGSSIFNGPAWAWAFGGASAFVLAWAVP